jgi:phosphoribosylformylglycinamidine (FGAM) synthase-like enzyme
VIGRYTDTGKLHITYDGQTCAYVDLDLLTAGFPQWEFDAEWRSPAHRGMVEPVVTAPAAQSPILLEMLSRPNICSKNWICRQYDHEVQGTSVIKPLVGVERDVPSDAAVLRPVLSSDRGLAFAQALLPFYSSIDAYHMTTCTIDEAVRRLVAVGGDLDHIGGVDNFCWPAIQYDPAPTRTGASRPPSWCDPVGPSGTCAWTTAFPCLSGKDSMYVDGHLPGRHGIKRKISALESLQFSTTSILEDTGRCTTLDPKIPGDLVYVLGSTRDELGASEYYDMLGYIGRNVPKVAPEVFLPLYRALALTIGQGLVASVHGIYRGGLGVHLAMKAMAGGFGLRLNCPGSPPRRWTATTACSIPRAPDALSSPSIPGKKPPSRGILPVWPWRASDR